MSKYIDADKLIAEIERRKEILDKYRDSFEIAACCEQELEWIKEFITSLQQEQLVNKDLGTLITCDIIEMTAKKAIDKQQDKEKEIELMTRKINYLRSLEENYVQQEHPGVDLEKALDEYYKNADFGPSEAIEYEIHKDIARHFYELGRARKED